MMEFKFIRFNPRRAARGVEAAEVEVKDGDNTERLWMSQADILANMKEHGASKSLQDAMNEYAKGLP